MVEIYRLMYLSRRVDDREILLKRQQKIFFQISGGRARGAAGGRGAGAAPRLRLVFPYYRDRALCLALGVTPAEMMLQAVGAATDPASGGRQMPTHWSSRPLHIVSTSSSTTTQLLHAVGCAEAGRYFSRHPEAAAKAEGDYRAFRDVKFHGDEVVFTSPGRGFNLAGRVLGGDEHRLQPEAAGHLLRGRQRLRHQRAGRGEHAGRQHLQAGGQLSQFPLCRDGRHRSGGLPARFSGGGGALPCGQGAGVCPRPLRAGLLPLAL